MGIIDSFVSKLILLPVILLSLSVHEMCHGYAAYGLGDSTAKSMGRLTINPLAHIDIIGLVSMMFFGFGWAKPVPVNFSRLKGGRFGPVLVSLAGPGSNLLMAFVFCVVFVCGAMLNVEFAYGFAGEMLIYALQINVVLAVFNLIPIPPLDGSKVVLSFLPYKWQYVVYKNEPIINVVLFALLYLGVLSPIIGGLSEKVLRFIIDVSMKIAAAIS